MVGGHFFATKLASMVLLDKNDQVLLEDQFSLPAGTAQYLIYVHQVKSLIALI